MNTKQIILLLTIISSHLVNYYDEIHLIYYII